MEVITREIKTEYFSNAILDEYFEGRSFCTYDIETLGLDPRRAPVILAGMMCVSPDGSAQVKQFFLHTSPHTLAACVVVTATTGTVHALNYPVL